jgi:hypothetical protein
MKGVKIFIEERPLYMTSMLHVFDDNYVYSIENGMVTQTKRNDDLRVAETPKPFFEGPSSFIYGMAEALSKHLESKGGIDTDQLNKGKIDRFSSEVDWLRGLIEYQFKK